ncbi:HlyD family efflux transporter periplasmic adaptor subunit [Terasakiella sp. SH-1]|uniref:efflux RND transporter periplasmic adaptor subunit n=1 Tax=Terasakiella sp. SH-1 TaxID=2560057 RepID=UPI0010742F25|nr:HlyD family efflux transporter periplasmic adaptor subunit [Terasakiella sp. SH-1]
MKEAHNQRLLKLLELEREARHATTRETLSYHVATRTRELLEYKQLILFRCNRQNQVMVETVSDVSVPDRHSSYCIWLQQAAKHIMASQAAGKIHKVSPEGLPEDLAEAWSQWMPDNVLWVPLITPQGQCVGAIWLCRPTPWVEAEIVLLERLADCYAHSWEALLKASPRGLSWKKWYGLAIAGVVVLLGIFPVSQSTLAPGEVVARQPLVVSAPLDGVVKTIDVLPNQHVKKGDLLLSFDDTALKNQVAIATQALSVAQAELLTARQDAFNNFKSQAQLALLQAKVDLKQAELAFAKDYLGRAKVYSEKDGIAVFRDTNDWVGRPTSSGERIMLLADPHHVELRIDLPVSDAIALEKGGDVRLFLDVSPLSPYEATLEHSSYETSISEDGTSLNFNVIARFDQGQNLPRIGLRGVAKLYGDKTILALYIMRKPLSALRQWIGW